MALKLVALTLACSLAVTSAFPKQPKACPSIVSRAEWGARPANPSSMGDNVPYMFVHHAEGPDCYDKEECMRQVRGIQNYHMDSNGWADIGYSFLVGGDGNIYEGRGWNKQGAHTQGYNSVGYGTCFIGSFMTKNPTEAAMSVYQRLAECAVDNGYVRSSYQMFGHRQAGSTDCPGDKLYQTIQGWKNWGDELCTNMGGTCVDWRYYVCNGGVETGLCTGDSNIRCCLSCDQTCQDNENEWSAGDGACEEAGGDCKLNSNYCDGVYTGGKCGGPNERQCCQKPDEGDCPRIISRAEWGARPANPSFMGDSVPNMFVHHAEGPDCYNQEDCMAQVRGIQNYHMDSNGWSDIGYSFLVGGDGNVYEGRGWNKIGAHTQGYNSVGYGTCFIGSFMTKNPTQEAMDVYQQLASCAVGLGKVQSNYEMFGHRQAGSTDCPGDKLYQTIQSWPKWTPGSP
ncbi:hypothetical protein TCAL_15127 [Tigriopus californicus]|uniref:Peptidoglycan-recognition protein n=1 Tax=Tigriopus californicus TaxID=6832 RepID=A0A553NTS5_TIGCA|nr:hypothetical protein TCAL_15127 [Tigriopus californicus]